MHLSRETEENQENLRDRQSLGKDSNLQGP